MWKFVITYIVLTVLLIMLCSCALPSGQVVQYSYTAVSTTTTAATSKSIPDHALSYATQADCNLFNLFEGKYYCEERDISKTYNRSGI